MRSNYVQYREYGIETRSDMAHAQLQTQDLAHALAPFSYPELYIARGESTDPAQVQDRGIALEHRLAHVRVLFKFHLPVLGII